MANELSKQTKNNGLLTVKEIPVDLAKKLTVENHYSHKWNTSFGVINYGIFQNGGEKCLGVAVFGNLMNPKSYKSICDGIEQNQIIELNRLWVDDLLGHNTETVFLSLCFKLMKKDHPHIKLVQSFADGRLGCGTIYKASNFNYYGKSDSLFFEHVLTGETQHKVPFENTDRIAKMMQLNLEIAKGNFKAFTVSTYRYIYILDRKYEKLIKLKRHPYPEYNKGFEYINDYVQTIGPLSRAYLGYFWLNYNAEMTQLQQYITEHYGELSHEQLRDYAKSKTMDKYLVDEDFARERIKQRYDAHTKKINRTGAAA